MGKREHRYYRGLTDDEKKMAKKSEKRGKALDDSDPSKYQEWPSDKSFKERGGKTKTSEYTKAFHEKYDARKNAKEDAPDYRPFDVRPFWNNEFQNFAECGNCKWWDAYGDGFGHCNAFDFSCKEDKVCDGHQDIVHAINNGKWITGIGPAEVSELIDSKIEPAKKKKKKKPLAASLFTWGGIIANPKVRRRARPDAPSLFDFRWALKSTDDPMKWFSRNYYGSEGEQWIGIESYDMDGISLELITNWDGISHDEERQKAILTIQVARDDDSFESEDIRWWDYTTPDDGTHIYGTPAEYMIGDIVQIDDVIVKPGDKLSSKDFPFLDEAIKEFLLDYGILDMTLKEISDFSMEIYNRLNAESNPKVRRKSTVEKPTEPFYWLPEEMLTEISKDDNSRYRPPSRGYNETIEWVNSKGKNMSAEEKIWAGNIQRTISWRNGARRDTWLKQYDPNDLAKFETWDKEDKIKNKRGIWVEKFNAVPKLKSNQIVKTIYQGRSSSDAPRVQITEFFTKNPKVRRAASPTPAWWKKFNWTQDYEGVLWTNWQSENDYEGELENISFKQGAFDHLGEWNDNIRIITFMGEHGGFLVIKMEPNGSKTIDFAEKGTATWKEDDRFKQEVQLIVDELTYEDFGAIKAEMTSDQFIGDDDWMMVRNPSKEDFSKMSPQEIQEKATPGWRILKSENWSDQEGTGHYFMERKYELDNFEKVEEFVEMINDAIIELDHHPEIAYEYNMVVVRTWSHDIKSIDERDYTLAETVDMIYKNFPKNQTANPYRSTVKESKTSQGNTDYQGEKHQDNPKVRRKADTVKNWWEDTAWRKNGDSYESFSMVGKMPTVGYDTGINLSVGYMKTDPKVWAEITHNIGEPGRYGFRDKVQRRYRLYPTKDMPAGGHYSQVTPAGVWRAAHIKDRNTPVNIGPKDDYSDEWQRGWEWHEAGKHGIGGYTFDELNNTALRMLNELTYDDILNIWENQAMWDKERKAKLRVEKNPKVHRKAASNARWWQEASWTRHGEGYHYKRVFTKMPTVGFDAGIDLTIRYGKDGEKLQATVRHSLENENGEAAMERKYYLHAMDAETAAKHKNSNPPNVWISQSLENRGSPVLVAKGGEDDWTPAWKFKGDGLAGFTFEEIDSQIMKLLTDLSYDDAMEIWSNKSEYKLRENPKVRRKSGIEADWVLTMEKALRADITGDEYAKEFILLPPFMGVGSRNFMIRLYSDANLVIGYRPGMPWTIDGSAVDLMSMQSVDDIARELDAKVNSSTKGTSITGTNNMMNAKIFDDGMRKVFAMLNIPELKMNPIREGNDDDGHFYRWGKQAKYYFDPKNEKSKEDAYEKARKQAAAIFSSGYRPKQNPKKKDGDKKKFVAEVSKKTGIKKNILAKVYDKGIAAWGSGHRPGTNPVQWAKARVYAFVEKGGPVFNKKGGKGPDHSLAVEAGLVKAEKNPKVRRASAPSGPELPIWFPGGDKVKPLGFWWKKVDMKKKKYGEPLYLLQAQFLFDTPDPHKTMQIGIIETTKNGKRDADIYLNRTNYDFETIDVRKNWQGRKNVNWTKRDIEYIKKNSQMDMKNFNPRGKVWQGFEDYLTDGERQALIDYAYDQVELTENAGFIWRPKLTRNPRVRRKSGVDDGLEWWKWIPQEIADVIAEGEIVDTQDWTTKDWEKLTGRKWESEEFHTKAMYVDVTDALKIDMRSSSRAILQIDEQRELAEMPNGKKEWRIRAKRLGMLIASSTWSKKHAKHISRHPGMDGWQFYEDKKTAKWWKDLLGKEAKNWVAMKSLHQKELTEMRGNEKVVALFSKETFTTSNPKVRRRTGQNTIEDIDWKVVTLKQGRRQNYLAYRTFAIGALLPASWRGIDFEIALGAGDYVRYITQKTKKEVIKPLKYARLYVSVPPVHFKKIDKAIKDYNDAQEYCDVILETLNQHGLFNGFTLKPGWDLNKRWKMPTRQDNAALMGGFGYGAAGYYNNYSSYLSNRSKYPTWDDMNEIIKRVSGKVSRGEMNALTRNPKVRRLSSDAVDSLDTGLLEYFDWRRDFKTLFSGRAKNSQWRGRTSEEREKLIEIDELISEIRINLYDDGRAPRIIVYGRQPDPREASGGGRVYMAMNYDFTAGERVGGSLKSLGRDYGDPDFFEMAKAILLDDKGWNVVADEEIRPSLALTGDVDLGMKPTNKNPKVRRLSKDAVTMDTGLLEYFNFEDLSDDDDEDDDYYQQAGQAYGVPKSEWQMNDDEEKNTLMNIKYLISEIRIDEIDYGIVRIAVYAKPDSGRPRGGSYVMMNYNVMTEERVGALKYNKMDHRPGFNEMAKSILLDDEGWSEVFGQDLYDFI